MSEGQGSARIPPLLARDSGVQKPCQWLTLDRRAAGQRPFASIPHLVRGEGGSSRFFKSFIKQSVK